MPVIQPNEKNERYFFIDRSTKIHENPQGFMNEIVENSVDNVENLIK